MLNVQRRRIFLLLLLIYLFNLEGEAEVIAFYFSAISDF